MSSQEPQESEHSLSRRSFVSLLGLGAAATFLTGCENDPAVPRAAEATPAPTAVASASPRTLITGDEFAPPVPTHPLPPPPVKIEPRNTYGILPRSMWAR